MNTWWAARNPREKMLVGIAALLLAIALIWQLVLSPAVYTLERAKLNHERATQTLARLDRIASMIEQGQTVLPPVTNLSAQDIAAVQAEANRMAIEANLLIEPLATADAASFKYRISEVSGPEYFKWIEQVETGLGVYVSDASINQNTDGSMTAETEFSLGGAR
ncbi:MAG: type II secretion system protein GspM [Hyphomonas sp.]